MARPLHLRGLLATLPLLAIGIVFVAVAPALADTIEWTDPNDGNFNDPNNWTVTSGIGSPPPAAGDLVELNEMGTYTITFTQNEASDQFNVRAGDVSFVSDSATLREYTITTGGADALVRDGGTLTIGSDPNRPVFVNVGDLMNIGTGTGDGAVTVSGANSQLDVLGAGLSHVGSSGRIGALTITAGATANFASNGTFRIGVSGNAATLGTVLVDSGSTLNTGHIELAATTSPPQEGIGQMTVTGAGSVIEQTLAGAALTIGSASGTGSGTLNVQSGGAFTSGTGNITLDTIGTINVQSGMFNANGPLTMSAGSTLTLNGGSLTANAGLDNSAGGTLNFFDGTLTVTGGAFAPNASGDYSIDGPTASEMPHLQLGVGATANLGGIQFAVGNANRGELTVSNGGTVSSINSVIGALNGSTGAATVDGEGSTWMSAGVLNVANFGDGTLDVQDGGAVSSGAGFVGFNANTTATATVDGAGSTWMNTDFLTVGNSGNGTLNILNGGAVSNTIGDIGVLAGSMGTVTVDGSDPNGNASSWTNSLNLSVGNGGAGTLNVQNGGAVSNHASSIGNNTGSTGTATIDGAGSTWTNSSFLNVGSAGNGTLNIQNGGTVSNTNGSIAGDPNSPSTVTVSDPNSSWTNTGVLQVGNSGNGTLNIQNDGDVSSIGGFIGSFSGSTGTATVDGAGSTWTNSSSLTVGNSGNGTLNIQNGGAVSNTAVGLVGRFSDSTGTATVDGAGSTWTNSAGLFVGGFNSAGGTGSLTVQDQGLVDVTGTLKIWNPGTVTLDGGSIVTDTFDNTDGGTFNFISGSLTINSGIGIGSGNPFPGSFTLNSDRHLATAGTTTIAAFRTLTLEGGMLQTGDLAINGTLRFNSGTLGITGAGGLTIGAAGPFGTSLSIGTGQNLDVTNTLTVDAGATLSLATGGSILTTSLDNSGVVNGSGAVTASLLNQVGGVVQAQLGDQLGFANTSHTNDGDFQLQGGRIDFGGSLTNSATGNILGRGTLDVGGTGLTNEGDLALSNGQTDIFGDVANQTTGRVIISGNADVTFWDDVSDSGTLFNVSTGSSATFFGTAGFGISGGGDVFFEDDVTPGTSPGLETFGGNVHFGVLADLQIEIAGTAPGSEFDVLNVLGDVTLAGTLDVSLLNPFSPSPGQSFEIIDIGGSLSGTFLGLAEGGLVGNFSGTNLLITYAGGDGNDVTLLAALPGDFDIDGDVDGFDFLKWQQGGSPDPLSQSDLNDWETNYGTVAPLAAASTAVPEPATCITLLFAMTGMLFRRHVVVS